MVFSTVHVKRSWEDEPCTRTTRLRTGLDPGDVTGLGSPRMRRSMGRATVLSIYSPYARKTHGRAGPSAPLRSVRRTQICHRAVLGQ